MTQKIFTRVRCIRCLLSRICFFSSFRTTQRHTLHFGPVGTSGDGGKKQATTDHQHHRRRRRKKKKQRSSVTLTIHGLVGLRNVLPFSRNPRHPFSSVLPFFATNRLGLVWGHFCSVVKGLTAFFWIQNVRTSTRINRAFVPPIF